jgi:hypothetical protein
MNDPKEIAINVVADWYASPAMCNEAVTDNALDSLRDTIAAAIQAEREDGCRRVNDAIGDRDPIIERLKAELERVTSGRFFASVAELTSQPNGTTIQALPGGAFILNPTKNEETMRLAYIAELERVKAERDEAVNLLEPFAEHARDKDAYPDNAEVGTRLGWCRAARAFVEKVKQ